MGGPLGYQPLKYPMMSDCPPLGRTGSREASALEDVRLIVVLSLFCIFVLFFNLGSAALFEPDEGRSAEVAREILPVARNAPTGRSEI